MISKESHISINYEGDVNGNPRFSLRHAGDEDDIYTMFCALMEVPEMRAAMNEAVFEGRMYDSVN